VQAFSDVDTVRFIPDLTLIARGGEFMYRPGEVVFESRPVIVVDDQRHPLPASFLSPFACHTARRLEMQ